MTLVAVSKRQPSGAIAEAIAAGHFHFGENYAQELADKRATIPDLAVRWHFIGALQSNKARLVVGTTLVHAVDRASVLAALESRAMAAGVQQDVLVQVNIAEDPNKSGVDEAAVQDLLARFADLQHVRCRGLMTMPPQAAPEATRPHFTALRRLAERLAKTTRPGVDLEQLSMGMSADFEVAIEEGATLVRVGTAVFGTRAVV